MDITTWQSILDGADQQEILEAVENAKALEKERFSEVILELTEKMMLSDEFSALVSALIVGNLAFEAAPLMQLELSDDITLTFSLDKS